MILLSYAEIKHYKIFAVGLLTVGILTDVFDGIIARRLKISTSHLRRMDSIVDQLFFLSVALATFIQCPDFFKNNKISLIILFGSEVLTYVVCLVKFKKEVATHSISSKIWTLILFATLVQIIATCNSGWLFQICLYTGLITRFEIILILLILREWTNDVPSIYHAILLRQGKTIKRNKLFNG